MSGEALPKRTFFKGVFIPTLYMFFMFCITLILYNYDQPLLAYVKTIGQTTPVGNSPVADAGFSFIYLGISVVAVFVLAYLFSRNKIKDKVFWVFAIVFLVAETFLATSLIYSVAPLYVVICVAAIWLLYVLAATKKVKQVLVLPFITIFAVMAAITFVFVFPPLTIVVLLAIFSGWDLYAVFKGPMTKLATGVIQMPKMKYLFMAKIGQVIIGLGDLLFYSMMATFALSFGIRDASVSIGFMTAGIWTTFYLLKSGKFRALPGLPIPIAAGLIGLAMAILTGIGP